MSEDLKTAEAALRLLAMRYETANIGIHFSSKLVYLSTSIGGLPKAVGHGSTLEHAIRNAVDTHAKKFTKGFVRLRGRDAEGGVYCFYCGTRYFPAETEEELAGRRKGCGEGFDCEDCRKGLPKLRAYWLDSRDGPEGDSSDERAVT